MFKLLQLAMSISPTAVWRIKWGHHSTISVFISSMRCFGQLSSPSDVCLVKQRSWATPKRGSDSRKRLSFAALKLDQLFEIKSKIWAQFNSSLLKATKLMRKFPFYYENCQVHNSGDNLWTLFSNRTLTWVVLHFLGSSVSMPLEEVSSSLTSHKTHSITYICIPRFSIRY